ncbi:MAG: type I restriction enzyme HsdR N-terminal domain-containing protein [Proteobacteria bacterium]|nr:type I restriction enzyme HsdR N-terminal domain-containing protein [Pseudomonadota bacterium]MBU1583705.1 type I restriction enzyme HsdR N-terminal domain-containing protein [Pseudomonadota bacterium]MBU2455297.1 type I restriction enzyme HsdR N-terminal domain-containing protein [Pseudomonadota bacterium]MBU2628998.1 type I restriction enzyme HsdR N-terminal domain-containing protein [Pseudomonadota bacterium]
MENQSNPHHLVLGKLSDFLTGCVLSDTHDERYRQKIAKKLVQNCKFKKTDILSNITIEVAAGKRKATLKVDFIITFQGKTVVLIKYAPGSLVTRRLSTIALSRILKPYQIPIVVITNGEDAEILDGNSGKVMATGLEKLPYKEDIEKNMASFLFKPIENIMFDQASRIAYACEVDGACPCDSDVCIIE